jgi:AcrR family transcriptional regulator
VAAAAELFIERGYAGTTIDAVAAQAGVSRRTVFQSVGSKVELLKTAWDWAVVGDDQPIPVADRAQVLARAVDVDPEAEALQARIDVEGRTGASMFVGGLAAIGGLRADVSAREGADMAWVRMNSLFARRLREDRGWSDEQVRVWLVRLTKASLLAGPA